MSYSNMERIFASLISCLLLCMSSCTSDSDPETARSEMKFDLKNIASRSSVTDDNSIKSASFKVFGDMRYVGGATESSPIVILKGSEVKFDSDRNEWTYSGTQYWFPEHEHSFVAVHPADAGSASYSNSTLSLTCTIPDELADAPDILAATHRRMYDGETSISGSSVSLGFFHIMSRLNFVLKCSEPAQKVDVSIELAGVNRTGTFSISPAPLLSGSKQTDDYTSSWGDFSNKGSLSVGFNDIDGSRDDIGEGIPLFGDDNALFLIPQPDNRDIKMKVSCTLYDENGEVSEQFASETPMAGWAQGKMYTYSLTIQAVVREINVNLVDVKDWQAAPDRDIDVPRK